MHLNMYCMPANTQIISKSVLNKPVSFQEELKMRLNLCWQKNITAGTTVENKGKLCWPSPSHASGDTKYVSTCVDQTHPLPATIENVS